VRKRYYLSFLLATVAGFLIFGVVKAQTGDQIGGSGFRVSPTRVDLSIERGESSSAVVSVQNVTSTTQTARLVVDDFGPSGDESGTPKILIGNDAVENYAYSIKPFVQPVDDFKLAPGQEVNIPVTLDIPDSASPGSYYGLIRFVGSDNNDLNNLDQSAVALSASVGVVFLIQVPGDTVDLLEMEQIGAADANGNIKTFFGSPPANIAVRIANKGNTFQAPFGKVSVEDWSGKTIFEYELNDITPRGNVLPDSIRKFVKPTENIGSFGRYTINANISYGDGGNVISAKATFWVIPWLTILLGAIALAALVFLATRGIKAYNARIVSRAKKY
jgi:hypothetical protein